MANRDENPRWQSPGGKLLRRILPAWRASLRTDLADELDPFVDENLAELTRMVGFWIVEDAQRESRQLISDAALQDAADALKDADELSPLVGLVRPVVGHFWGMQALMSRAQEIELLPEPLVVVVEVVAHPVVEMLPLDGAFEALPVVVAEVAAFDRDIGRGLLPGRREGGCGQQGQHQQACLD